MNGSPCLRAKQGLRARSWGGAVSRQTAAGNTAFGKSASHLLLAVLLLGAGQAGCGDSSATVDPNEEPGTSAGAFVAYDSTFTDYHDWPSFDISDRSKRTELHDGDSLVLYVNKLPPTGSEEFPQGTVIVKEASGTSEMKPHTFAVVKRGGSYNRLLPGWEWFEITAVDDHRSHIVWRGVGPPKGEEYGGDPNGSCNTCHALCPAGVCSEVLRLENF